MASFVSPKPDTDQKVSGSGSDDTSQSCLKGCEIKLFFNRGTNCTFSKPLTENLAWLRAYWNGKSPQLQGAWA